MRTLAQILSLFFHPLLLIFYGLLLLISLNPYSFGVHSIGEADRLIIICFVYTFFFPALAIAMMRGLGMIDSLEMHTRQERWGPLIVCLVLYFWFFANIHQNPSVASIFSVFVLGAAIALSLSFLATLFDKVSLHGVAMGGFIGLILVLSIFEDGIDFVSVGTMRIHVFLFLFASIILAGAVGTARLHLKAHTLHQVLTGYLIGFSAQLLATGILY